MSKGILSILVIALGVLLQAPILSPALAVEPDEILSDPVLEQRAREVSKGLRCVVCQNQSIDESNADLARDMRLLVRDRIKAGDSNQQVVDFMVSSYGDYVLLDPPFKASTLVLWLGPVLIVLFAVAGFWFYFRREGAPAPAGGAPVPAPAEAPLSDAEKARLAKLLGSDEGNNK